MICLLIIILLPFFLTRLICNQMSLKESTLLDKQTFYESPQEQPDCQWAVPWATCSRYSCLYCRLSRPLDLRDGCGHCSSQGVSGDGCTLPLKYQLWKTLHWQVHLMMSDTWDEILMMTHQRLILKRALLKSSSE